nr:hypothetical protein [Pedobacter panaciterrae]
MTDQQANELRIYLIDELNNNGFSDIVIEANTRLEENSPLPKENRNGIEFSRTPNNQLNRFLAYSIEVFRDYSNHNYNALLEKFNSLSPKEIIIDKLEVTNEDNPNVYDLRELPDYQPIINVLLEIQQDLNQEI